MSMHSWPSPPIFLSIAIFLSCFVPPFWVSLSVLCTRKLLLRKSLFLDKNLNQIDLIIPHNFHFAQCLLHWMGGRGSGGGKVVAAVAVGSVVSVVLAVQKESHWHHLIRVLGSSNGSCCGSFGKCSSGGGGGGGGGSGECRECCAGGSKGIAPASFDQGLRK